MPELIINGRTIHAEADMTILEAAKNGRYPYPDPLLSGRDSSSGSLSGLCGGSGGSTYSGCFLLHPRTGGDGCQYKQCPGIETEKRGC